jgi:hypothetical protein
VRLGFYSWWPGRLVSACMTAHAMERVTQPTLAAIPFRAALAYVSSNPRPWDGGLWDSYNKQPAHGAIGRPAGRTELPCTRGMQPIRSA